MLGWCCYLTQWYNVNLPKINIQYVPLNYCFFPDCSNTLIKFIGGAELQMSRARILYTIFFKKDAHKYAQNISQICKNNFKYAIKYAINLKGILIKLVLDFKYFSKSIIKLNKTCSYYLMPVFVLNDCLYFLYFAISSNFHFIIWIVILSVITRARKKVFF